MTLETIALIVFATASFNIVLGGLIGYIFAKLPK